MENFDMKEMPVSEYQTTLDKWQKQKEEEAKKEENAIKEDDWECQKCNHINTMDRKNISSAYCKKCHTKNDTIEYMIRFANDKESTNQAEIEMDYYRKNKNGELDRQFQQQ
ncbi:MAG: hypothetical protein ACPHN0_08200 [Candidatus Poseidoniaceae archaeon]